VPEPQHELVGAQQVRTLAQRESEAHDPEQRIAAEREERPADHRPLRRQRVDDGELQRAEPGDGPQHHREAIAVGDRELPRGHVPAPANSPPQGLPEADLRLRERDDDGWPHPTHPGSDGIEASQSVGPGAPVRPAEDARLGHDHEHQDELEHGAREDAGPQVEHAGHDQCDVGDGDGHGQPASGGPHGGVNPQLPPPPPFRYRDVTVVERSLGRQVSGARRQRRHVSSLLGRSDRERARPLGRATDDVVDSIMKIRMIVSSATETRLSRLSLPIGDWAKEA
jgi:hypothetical protein